MKLVVYTALIAEESLPLEEVGQFFPFVHPKEDVRYIAFTNRQDLKSDFWEVRKVDVWKNYSPRMMSRFLKWNPDKANLPEHTHTLWLDSQVYFTIEPKALTKTYLQDKYHTAIHHHTDIYSAYLEGMVSAYLYKTDTGSKINPQLERYFEEGLPFQYDHYETGVLIRKNCNESRFLNEIIFKELEEYSIRDQISTPYAVWKRRQAGDEGILTIRESFTAHKGGLPLPKSKYFFTVPKPSEKLREDLTKR